MRTNHYSENRIKVSLPEWIPINQGFSLYKLPGILLAEYEGITTRTRYLMTVHNRKQTKQKYL